MNLFFSMDGRIGRLKYWLGNFVLILAASPFALYYYFYLEPFEEDASNSWFMILASILFIWPSACLVVKRYHDRNKSGFWYFLIFIPIIGPIWQWFECCFLSGTPGNNNYGPMPGPLIGGGPSVDEQISALRASAQDRWNEQPSGQDTYSSQQSGFGNANRSSGFGRRNA